MHISIAARRIALLATALLLGPAAAIAQQAPDRFQLTDPSQQKKEAIEHSDAYYTRLTIHRIGSYAELPLFAAQVYLGSKLIQGGAADWVKPTHRAVATGIGALFAVNTVTGVWNLVESRKDPGKTKRFLHATLMLAADAGFAYTGLVTSRDASRLGEDAKRHRNAALTSVGAATAGTLVMWFWPEKD